MTFSTKRLRLVICEANIVFGRKVSLNASCQSSRQDAEIENFPIEQEERLLRHSVYII